MSVTAGSAAGQCVINVRYDDGSATRLPTDVPAPCQIGADASGQQRLERLNGQNVLLVIGGTPNPTVSLALEALGMQKCGRFVQGLVFGTNNIRTSDLVIQRSSFCPTRDMTKEMYLFAGHRHSPEPHLIWLHMMTTPSNLTTPLGAFCSPIRDISDSAWASAGQDVRHQRSVRC